MPSKEATGNIFNASGRQTTYLPLIRCCTSVATVAVINSILFVLKTGKIRRAHSTGSLKEHKKKGNYEIGL